jgi:Protein of unknown function (DUF3306)
MAQENEKFLSRWSRLKREANEVPEKRPEEGPLPALPAVDTLTTESNFAGFMHPKVEDALRRVALKKLFSDPHFNVPDPFEAYSGDWTGGEAISEEMLATLNQARTLLFDKQDNKEENQEKHDAPGEEIVAQTDNEAKDDDAGSKAT